MHFKLGLVSGSVCLVIAGCGPLGGDTNDSSDGGGGSAAGPAAGGGGGGGSGGTSAGTGGTGDGGTGGSFGLGGAGAEPPDAGDVDACASSQAVAEPVPAALQFIVDTSGSMKWGPDGNQTPAAGQSKWEITKTAIESTALVLPAPTALGLGFYPNTDLDVPCFVEQMALPLAPLGDSGSSQRQQLSAVLAGVVPLGGTPTHSAYRFGISQLRASNPPGNGFLVLITDGVPTFTAECSGDGHTAVDSSPIAAEAAQAYAEGIRTFVIGSPGSEAARSGLSRIASAGGTAPPGCTDQGPSYCHFDMTTEPDLAAALTNALSSIVDQVLSCQYPVPPPPAGQTLDRSRVNVVYTSGAGVSETIARDPSSSDCNVGWQYSGDGASITLCGATCDRIKHDAAGKVELEFGCETKIAPVE